MLFDKNRQPFDVIFTVGIFSQANQMSQNLKFLSNAPLGEDLFEGKSQDSIANAIVAQIEHNAGQIRRGQQQKMIGIEGSWGSGKSNLIEIVKKKFSQKYGMSKFYFFTYDVWGHQEDLQRKAILNELVDFLIEKRAVKNNEKDGDNNNWRERVKKTTGVVTETKQTQIPKISFGIIICALALVIAPICENITVACGFVSNLIHAIPFFLILLALLCSIVRNGFKKGVTEFISIYKDKEIETTNREFVSETNPSVIDFRAFLSSLSSALEGKHLVIFFDNMDRLPKEKIEGLWSSIHTFFAENNGHKNISCIVSFDRTHIKGAFSLCDGATEECGNDYIDKTFDVVYRVAPPILSDWKNFFKVKWLEAFNEIKDKEEFERVVQVYDILSGKRDLTPRSIIRFINELVLTKKSFVVPERYIAIFILRRDVLIENPLYLGCLGNLKAIYERDPNYFKYISSIVYQVSPEKTMSVVYEASLRRALEQGDKEEVERISKAPFFWDVLENTLKSMENLDDAVVSLDFLPQDALNSVQSAMLWQSLFWWLKEKEPQDFQKERLFGVMKKSQEILLKHVEKTSKIELIKDLLRIFARDGFSFKQYEPKTYTSFIERLSRYLPMDDLYSLLPNLSISAEAYLAILKEKGALMKQIPLDCPEMESYLANLNYMQLLEQDCLENLPDSTKRKMDVDATLNNLFAQNPVYSEENFLKLLKLFTVFPQYNINADEINWNLLGTLLNSTTIPSLKGIILAIRIIHCNYPVSSRFFGEMLSSPLPNDVKTSLLSYLSSQMTFEQILANEDMLHTYGVVQDYVKDAIVNGQYEITVKGLFEILPKLNDLSELLGIDLSPLLLKIMKVYDRKKETFDKLLKFKQDDPASVEQVLPYKTLQFVANQDSEFAKRLVQWLVWYFNSWSKDFWFARFKNPNLYGVKEAILIKYGWSSNAKDAMEAYLIELLNENKINPNQEIWSVIFESLSKSFKERLFKNIRDNFVNGRKIMDLNKFIFIGDALLKFGFVEQCLGDVLRTIVPSFLLEDNVASKIIAENFDQLKNVLKEETDAEDWLEKARTIASENENSPLKDLIG
ncbi:MAG: KAP family NTPase [Fibrobacter sp.]|nr:KAP family NTPase [Fibrobacter sp.]